MMPHNQEVRNFLLLLVEEFDKASRATKKPQYEKYSKRLVKILEIIETWGLYFTQLEDTVETLAQRLAAVLDKVKALQAAQGQVPPAVEAQVAALEQAVGITQPAPVTPPAG